MKGTHRSCARKHRFKTFFDANRKAIEYGMRVYDCNICKGFHLTSQPLKTEYLR